ncbi:hypothetical protein HDV62DRAFT_366595 [Trichoderma sp. SZMC 28011]
MVDGSEYMPDLHIAETNEDKNVRIDSIVAFGGSIVTFGSSLVIFGSSMVTFGSSIVTFGGSPTQSSLHRKTCGKLQHPVLVMPRGSGAGGRKYHKVYFVKHATSEKTDPDCIRFPNASKLVTTSPLCLHSSILVDSRQRYALWKAFVSKRL